MAESLDQVLCCWLAQEPRGKSADRSAASESIVVFLVAYETKRERSHGVVSFTSGRETARPTASVRERDGRTWTTEKFRN